jgi:hypothetical protein
MSVEIFIQEFFSRGEGGNIIPLSIQQTFQCPPQGIIVVNYENSWPLAYHACFGR